MRRLRDWLRAMLKIARIPHTPRVETVPIASGPEGAKVLLRRTSDHPFPVVFQDIDAFDNFVTAVNEALPGCSLAIKGVRGDDFQSQKRAYLAMTDASRRSLHLTASAGAFHTDIWMRYHTPSPLNAGVPGQSLHGYSVQGILDLEDAVNRISVAIERAWEENAEPVGRWKAAFLRRPVLQRLNFKDADALKFQRKVEFRSVSWSILASAIIALAAAWIQAR